MEAENPSQLSPSMRAILRAQPDSVDAAWLVKEIMRSHRNYAGEKAHEIARSIQWSTRLRTQPVEAWFIEARTVLKRDFGEPRLLRNRLS
jgi:hypothetical protein